MVIDTYKWFVAQSTNLLCFPFAANHAALPADYKRTEMYDIPVVSAIATSQAAQFPSF